MDPSSPFGICEKFWSASAMAMMDTHVAPGATGLAQGAMTVLVVDDEPAVARHLTDGLTLLGFSTDCVGSADEAMRRLAANPSIGVVISDIRMPGTDGLCLARDIIARWHPHRPVQVILITGHALEDEIAAPVRESATALLKKPFRLREAARVLSLALEAAAAQGCAGTAGVRPCTPDTEALPRPLPDARSACRAPTATGAAADPQAGGRDR